MSKYENPKNTASIWLGELLGCKDCVPNFDGRGGWKFCKKHLKELKNHKWSNPDIDITIP